jgi:membrane protein DedA with SNARE-associated domain/pimeloyl-ACP methyl ester carboxylesterase
MNVKQRSWFSWWGAALLLYLLLLGSSHVWQLLNPYVAQPDDDQQTVRVQAVAGDSLLTNQNVTIAYLDKYAGSAPNPPVILLLHGSPIATPMFSKLISELSDKFRVIAPDFPGYDGSSREVPSYSINSYSLYIKQLMDLLKVDNAHVVGYSLGGGVGINMAHKYPGYVQSLDLLSSIGVQELELLGSYQLNHVIHGAQLSFIWMFHNGIPHFGYFNDFLLNIPYAKSFYESDQRPLRSYLRGFQKPMLIQHGTGDELVPLAAAKEHHRIVPQSSLKLYSGGHGAVQSNHHAIAEDLSAFVKSVENENALPASQASSVRIEQAQKPFDDINFEKFKGLALIIMMLVIVLGTLISEDLTCIGAGLMAARGLIGFWPAVAACFLGIFVGDILLYLAGRWLGKAAVRRAPFKWILSKKDLERSSEWFKAKGPAIIIASRFLPGSRMPTYFSAGAIGASFWMFTGYFLIACIIWTPLLVGISTLVGAELLSHFAAYQEYALLFLLGIILFMIFITKVILPLLSYRGRRLMLSRWR